MLLNKVHIARGLSAGDRRVVAEAWLALLWLRLLTALPYRLWRSRLQRALAPAPPPPLDPGPAGDRRLVRLFEIARRNQPFPANCLLRSLALHGLLSRRGSPVRMVIGVRRGGGRLEAHAWIEAGSRVLNERDDIAGVFTPLASKAAPAVTDLLRKGGAG